MIWLLTILSLIGVWLNIKKKRICFAIWTVTNITWCIIDFNAGIPAQACLFAIYTALAIKGWFEWRNDSKTLVIKNVNKFGDPIKNKIIFDLRDREGIKKEWELIDDDIMTQIHRARYDNKGGICQNLKKKSNLK